MSNGVTSLSGREGPCGQGDLYLVLRGPQTLYLSYSRAITLSVKSNRENSVSVSSYRMELYTV